MAVETSPELSVPETFSFCREILGDPYGSDRIFYQATAAIYPAIQLVETDGLKDTEDPLRGIFVWVRTNATAEKTLAVLLGRRGVYTIDEIFNCVSTRYPDPIGRRLTELQESGQLAVATPLDRRILTRDVLAGCFVAAYDRNMAWKTTYDGNQVIKEDTTLTTKPRVSALYKQLQGSGTQPITPEEMMRLEKQVIRDIIKTRRT